MNHRIPVVFLIAAGAASTATAQTTTVVSVAMNGFPGGNAYAPSISADGRFVAFTSNSNFLVPNDTNAAQDIFVRDRLSSTTVRVSVDSAGVQGNLGSVLSSISADGRFVAFSSAANNLVPNDTNTWVDAFLHDIQTGSTKCVSVDSAGVQGNSSVSYVDISADGRFVAFSSTASSLSPGDSNGVTDVFLHDTLTGQTTRVSVSSSGAEGDDHSHRPAVSGDGRYVTFSSEATNLVTGDTNGITDVFVRDTLTNQTTRVSLSSTGAEGDNYSRFSSISADGRYVAFESAAVNLVTGDTNARDDVFVRDVVNGITTRVSLGPLGAQANGHSGGVRISANGRHVSFHSRAWNLASPQPMTSANVFVHDVLTGQTTLVNQSTAGVAGNGDSFSSSISANGDVVAFESLASNLVTGDLPSSQDVFVRAPGDPPTPFCLGDGSGAACPCGNNGTAGHGCGHSLNSSGALMVALGMASISLDSLSLRAVGVPSSGSGTWFQGTAALGNALSFGDGLLCTSGTLVRLGVVSATGAVSQFPRVGIDPPVSIAGLNAAGDLRYYQLWFHDTDTGFCTPSLFNLTNGVSLTWAP